MKTKHFVSQVFLFSLLVLVTTFSSCSSGEGNEPSSLSTKKVTKMVNKYLKEKQDNVRYAHFNVGRFRCDKKEERDMYRKLELAGVITLNIDTTKTSTKVKTGRDYWAGKDIYETKTRTMYTMTVGLTDETQKYLLDESPSKPVYDPDMVQPVFGDFPEFHLDEVVYDTPEVKEGEEASKLVYVKGTDVSLLKVRNLELNPQNKCEAFCEIILQNGKVTPAYRVLHKSYDNEKFLVYGQLNYYIDKGWTIVRVSKEPIIKDSGLAALERLLR